uniref:Breast cancer type 1 susceptibility protein homolog n=1 Tax=Angiostrongylus cantonensis TaxID=6313 RepID=A0A158PAU9_ANGCA
MPKEFEFQFDVDEDEETWLTPQLSERSLGTQSKPVDLKEWFGQIQTSERASLLSKKLHKYAQKRAARSDRLRKSVSSSLDVVSEGDGSPERTHLYDHQEPLDDSGISANCLENVTMKKEVATCHNETDESGVAGCIKGFISPGLLTSNVPHFTSDAVATSTSFADSVSRNGLPNRSPFPDQLATTGKQIASDSDEEFFDACSEFCEEVENLMLTSSMHEDQHNGNRMLPDDDSGISVVRNCMSQSLTKVEEEAPASHQAVQTKEGKPLRSSSLSPRPISTAVSNAKQSQTNSLPSHGETDSIEQRRNPTPTIDTQLSYPRIGIKQQTRLSRPATSHRTLSIPRQLAPAPPRANQQHVVLNTRVPNPKAQLLHNLISTPAEIDEQPDRNRNVNVLTDSKNSRPTSGRQTSKTQSDIPDLAALREIARQQEEALRQAVEQQQHGNIERKYSWQNEKSLYSSAGSLVSSKSADMSTLHKANANVVSRIPASTRVPRRSGIPAPSKRPGKKKLTLCFHGLEPMSSKHSDDSDE